MSAPPIDIILQTTAYTGNSISSNMFDKLSKNHPDIVAKMRTDANNLKGWLTAINQMPRDAPGKQTLLAKYRERASNFAKIRASYKKLARFF